MVARVRQLALEPPQDAGLRGMGLPPHSPPPSPPSPRVVPLSDLPAGLPPPSPPPSPKTSEVGSPSTSPLGQRESRKRVPSAKGAAHQACQLAREADQRERRARKAARREVTGGHTEPSVELRPRVVDYSWLSRASTPLLRKIVAEEDRRQQAEKDRHPPPRRQSPPGRQRPSRPRETDGTTPRGKFTKHRASQ